MEKIGKKFFFTGSSYGAELSLNTFLGLPPMTDLGFYLSLAIAAGIFLPGYVKLPHGTLYCGLTGARPIKGRCRPAEPECFKPEELYNVRRKKQKCGFESPSEVKFLLDFAKKLLFNMVLLQNALIFT